MFGCKKDLKKRKGRAAN